MRIGFLGTGIMGAPMARHLARAGHDVTVWNRTIEKAQPLTQDGATVADDPAEAVRGAEVIVTMLTDGAAVEEVIRHAEPGIGDGVIWWQASTVGIEATERLMLLAGQQGLRYVDGPVLGTRGPAEEGKLTVLAAGADGDVDACVPLFEAVATKIIRLGDAGEATRMKLVLNHWVLAITDAIAETIAFAEGVDLDPAVFLEAIEGGPLDLGYAKLKGPGMIEGELPLAFPLKHARKDADLVLEAARRHDVDLALAPVVRDRFVRAEEDGHGDADMGMVVEATRPSRP
jgi:3-hydroxyisobutyrate dehydrogenase